MINTHTCGLMHKKILGKGLVVTDSPRVVADFSPCRCLLHILCFLVEILCCSVYCMCFAGENISKMELTPKPNRYRPTVTEGSGTRGSSARKEDRYLWYPFLSCLWYILLVPCRIGHTLRHPTVYVPPNLFSMFCTITTCIKIFFSC